MYTIGHSKNYRKAREYLAPVIKRGKFDNYDGGYVFKTTEDAQKRIDEANYEGYEIFGLIGEWNVDTYPSSDGWWHNLLYDCEIIFLDGEV